METITLDKKKYVIVEKREYEKLQLKAAMNEPLLSDRISLKEAKKRTYKLFDKWDKEK
jgi:hypothetical protein